VRLLAKGDRLQFERRGYFIVDKVAGIDGDRTQLIMIPDGKTKSMSVIGTKVDKARGTTNVAK
jgi:glutamyl-tRNA synthetase